MLKWLAIIGFLPVVALSQDLAPSGMPVIVAAEFADPTDRYKHGVFGNETEFGTLVLTIDTCFRCTQYEEKTIRIVLPQARVFEDLAPRLADLDGDGRPEVIVIETERDLGAQLSIYGMDGLIAATPNIGLSQRWLAPAGVGDFTGDGRVEIAYIETPHLGKTLRIWSLHEGKLTQIASAPNLTNHQFGEDFISGGVRDCGSGDEVITADGSWRNIMASRIIDGNIVSTIVTPFNGQRSFRQVLNCNR